jgi:hypothetical protein
LEGLTVPRLVYLSGLGLALVALAFVVTDAALGPRPGVTEANARRIRPGMTLREVETVLGGRGLCMADGTASTVFHPEPYLWAGPDARILVVFTSAGLAEADWHEPRVATNGVTFQRTASPTLLERLRTWLGW